MVDDETRATRLVWTVPHSPFDRLVVPLTFHPTQESLVYQPSHSFVAIFHVPRVDRTFRFNQSGGFKTCCRQ
jgi:hypothetical protein